jgi:hypothetical protein
MDAADDHLAQVQAFHGVLYVILGEVGFTPSATRRQTGPPPTTALSLVSYRM